MRVQENDNIEKCSSVKWSTGLVSVRQSTILPIVIYIKEEKRKFGKASGRITFRLEGNNLILFCTDL